MRLITLREEEQSLANAKQDGMASTKRDDLEALLSVSQPVRTKTSLAGKLPKLITNLAHNALGKSLEALNDK